jgi:hypothetical protein
MTTMIPAYIAGKFRGPTSWDIAKNVYRAEEVHRAACRLGLASISPHCNTSHFQGECTDEFWIAMTLELLRMVARSGGILILVPGWEESSGTRGEVREALSLGMPVFECEPSQRDDPKRLREALHIASVLWSEAGIVIRLGYVPWPDGRPKYLGDYLDAHANPPTTAQEPAAPHRATTGPSVAQESASGQPGGGNGTEPEAAP